MHVRGCQTHPQLGAQVILCPKHGDDEPPTGYPVPPGLPSPVQGMAKADPAARGLPAAMGEPGELDPGTSASEHASLAQQAQPAGLHPSAPDNAAGSGSDPAAEGAAADPDARATSPGLSESLASQPLHAQGLPGIPQADSQPLDAVGPAPQLRHSTSASMAEQLMRRRASIAPMAQRTASGLHFGHMLPSQQMPFVHSLCLSAQASGPAYQPSLAGSGDHPSSSGTLFPTILAARCGPAGAGSGGAASTLLQAPSMPSPFEAAAMLPPPQPPQHLQMLPGQRAAYLAGAPLAGGRPACFGASPPTSPAPGRAAASPPRARDPIGSGQVGTLPNLMQLAASSCCM